MPVLVSILIPCYNQAFYLGQTLDSIINQTYKSWEGIIINDGSTDDTEEIALQYVAKDHRFKYIKQNNKGLSNSRNAGLKIANGSFIQLLDADDLLECNKIKSAVDLYLANDENNDLIFYSSMRYFEDKHPDILRILGRQDLIAHVELKQDDSNKSQQDLIKIRNPFVISAPLYPSKLFDDIGYFDENLSALEDWDLHLRCAEAGYRFHHYYEVESRTLIRLHDNSMMRNQKLLDENFYKVILKHKLINNGPTNKKEEKLSQKFFKAVTPPIIIRLINNFSKI